MTESSLTMNRWWHRHRRSPLCLSLYAVCFVIVLSFILFEVLDVDGSDFQVPTGRNATLRATTTEEHANALRRAPLINAVAPLVLVGRLTLDDALRLAERENPTLRAKRFELDVTRAGEITAGLRPNPSA